MRDFQVLNFLRGAWMVYRRYCRRKEKNEMSFFENEEKKNKRKEKGKKKEKKKHISIASSPESAGVGDFVRRFFSAFGIEVRYEMIDRWTRSEYIELTVYICFKTMLCAFYMRNMAM
jgi:hypothetical protein